MAQVDNLDAFEAELQFLGQLLDALVVTQEDRVANALGLGLYGSLEHGGVDTLGKYDTLRIAAGGIVELTGELALLAHKLTELSGVSLPIGDGLAGYTALHGGLCHGQRDLGDETWVYGFGDEVGGTEGEVVHVVGFVHYVGNGLLGQVCNGMYGSQLHLFVDGCSLCVECTAEDVGEADNVVDLVGIVGATGSHQYVGA